MIEKIFDVTGMSCASCAGHVEKAVRDLSGVKNINVNLLSNNMTVLFDENKVDEKSIIDAVVSAGYGASSKKKLKAK